MKPMTLTKIHHTRSETIHALYRLAQRPGGVVSREAADALGHSAADCCTRLNQMRATGRLQARPTKEGRTKTRFYADPAVPLAQIENRKAVEHMARLEAAKAARPHVPRGPRLVDAVTGQPPAQRGPRHKGPSTPEVLVTARRVVCPSPQVDHRYQLAPTERVLGGFATMGPGRYDESAGVGFAAYLRNPQPQAA